MKNLDAIKNAKAKFAKLPTTQSLQREDSDSLQAQSRSSTTTL